MITARDSARKAPALHLKQNAVFAHREHLGCGHGGTQGVPRQSRCSAVEH